MSSIGSNDYVSHSDLSELPLSEEERDKLSDEEKTLLLEYGKAHGFDLFNSGDHRYKAVALKVLSTIARNIVENPAAVQWVLQNRVGEAVSIGNFTFSSQLLDLMHYKIKKAIKTEGLVPIYEDDETMSERIIVLEAATQRLLLNLQRLRSRLRASRQYLAKPFQLNL